MLTTGLHTDEEDLKQHQEANMEEAVEVDKEKEVEVEELEEEEKGELVCEKSVVDDLSYSEQLKNRRRRFQTRPSRGRHLCRPGPEVRAIPRANIPRRPMLILTAVH